MKNQANAMTPEQEIKLRSATTWIPLTIVVGLISTVIYGTWALSQERAQIYGQINQINTNVQSLAATVEKLTEAIAKPNSLAFTRHDWIMDCLRTQIANPTWKCIYSDAQHANGSEHAKGL